MFTLGVIICIVGTLILAVLGDEDARKAIWNAIWIFGIGVGVQVLIVWLLFF